MKITHFLSKFLILPAQISYVAVVGLVIFLGLCAHPSQVQAQVFEDITQNFGDDTSGNVGRLNFFDPVYGNSNPNAEDARIVVPLTVPNTSAGPLIVKKVSIELHDHDEALVFDLRLNQNQVPNLLSNIDVKTANGLRCNDANFITRLNDHHYPQNAAQDADCYVTHNFDINQPATKIILNVSKNNASGATSSEKHLHIRNITWTVEKPSTPPAAIPEPQLSILNCVDPTAIQQTNDILRVSWGTPGVPIQTVAISDSQAANRWDATTGRFWSKETRGATSLTAPVGFFPRSATTPNPLIFKPNTTYSVVLWDGSRLSNPKNAVFQACSQPQQPATASLSNACIQRTSTQPLAIDFNLSNIDIKGATFNKAIIYLDLDWSVQNAYLSNFLGTPSWSDWATNNRAPQLGDKFGYVLASYDTLPATGTLPFTWNDTIIIGGQAANYRRISDLVAWIKATGYSPTYKVSALLQTIASGNIIQSKPAATTSVDLSSTACVQNPVCVPTCGVCSIAGSPNGCNDGGTCPAGASRGTPNPVDILIPEPGQPLNVIDNKVTISWRQQPTDNASAAYVDNYQVMLYPSARYSSADAAQAAYLQNSGDVVFFYRPASQGNTANIYAQSVFLPEALLSAGRVTIAIRSLNLTCPGSTDTLGNPAYPNNPGGGGVPGPGPGGGEPPGPGEPPVTPWTEEPEIPLEATFAGKFYKSDSCSIGTAVPLSLGGNSAVVIVDKATNQEYSGAANGTSYSITVPPSAASYIPKLRFDQAGQSETLACSSACNPADIGGYCQRPDTTGPTTTAHFFLESYNLLHDSWWQARGGLVYGHTGVSSDLPLNDDDNLWNEDCTDAGDYCKIFLIRELLNGSDLSAGIPYTGGAFTNIEGWFTERTDNAHAENGVDAKTKITKENYAFFMNQLEEAPTQDITQNIFTLANIPAGTEELGAKVSYRNGSLTVNPNTTWNISSGEKRVIFVNGDLKIAQTGDTKVITVQPGGFIAFIVAGDIIFEPTVGHTSTSDIVANSSLEPNVEGVFIADGRIITQSAGSDDKKFVGAGSFVGWGGVDLQRTFEKDQLGRVRNNTTPVENFLYRPDFLLSAPDLMKSTEMTWREVN